MKASPTSPSRNNFNQPLTGTDLTIDATALKAGLYMVQVTTPEAVQTSRVVVE